MTTPDRNSRKQAVLANLRRGLTEAQARDEAGVPRRTCNNWLRDDPEFAAAVAQAKNLAPVPAATSRAVAAAPEPGPAPDGATDVLLVPSQESAKVNKLRAEKLGLELNRIKGQVLSRFEVEELLQEVLNRIDKMDGEVTWLRLENLYGVPYDESRDYWVGEITELTRFLNGWLEVRSG